ncbi:Heterokaryon incompatibility protein [Hyphodiscus hymeniophilus]|uniref:Heterokaryon incompatibility protein n=1 Tax=Hyphodiscus hymeniophilus TaxID=353542 RepID=A0A9P6SPX3_9HELO|nr:Heterokaryon incompatibility protein [Hyphodiscus hymeniophilus]
MESLNRQPPLFCDHKEERQAKITHLKADILELIETASESRPAFTHRTLPTPYSFRLLELVGRSKKKSLEFRIKAFPIANAPDYYALSYCWGATGRKVAIECQGEKLEVSSSLGEALERLYSHNKGRTRWLWIDQICIDQENMSERTYQVRMMKIIYEKAAGVIIWLGPRDEHTDLALQDLRQAVLSDEPADKTRRGSLGIRSLWKGVKNDKRHSLYQFLSSPWFRRAWIIQEVVVPEGAIVILCGDAEIQWSKFVHAALTLLAKEHHDRRLEEILRPVQTIRELAAENGLWDLSSLLLMTRIARATDPRDKIFAFLGLCGETERPDEWPLALRPDYSRSTKDVFRDATRYCIKTSKSLSVLSALHHVINQAAGENLGLPSWVPRWDAENFPIELSEYTTHRNEKGWKYCLEIGHNAAGSSSAETGESEYEDGLLLNGLQIDTNEYCMEPCSFTHLCAAYSGPCTCPKPSIFQPEAQAILSMWRWCFDKVSSCQDLHAVTEYLLCTITAGQSSAKGLQPAVLWSYLFAVAKHASPQSRNEHSVRRTGQVLQIYVSSLKIDDSLSRKVDVWGWGH